jgi:formylglycine-generating enzyme required for sulfatase activity
MKSLSLSVCVFAVASLLMTEAKADEANKAPTSSADPMIGREPGDVRDDNGLKMKLVWCPPGFVTMEGVEVVEEPAAKKKEGKPGNDDDDVVVVDPIEEPTPQPRKTTRITPVKVFLTKGYWLAKYEVTQSEWKQVMKTEPWKGQDFAKEGADNPATFVSWDDAVDFCRKLMEQERKASRLPTGWEYTLPTEAQWERACRARTETKFSFGDDESTLGEYGWFRGNASDADEQFAHRVGQKKANPWGLHDMHGNVWEWCRDVSAAKLPGGRDPEVKADENRKGSFRVGRGGSWFSDAAMCRSGFRDGNQPVIRFSYIGFRLALVGPDNSPDAALPVGKWKVEFTNGVTEVCDIFDFGGGHVTVDEPRRRSCGTVVVKHGSSVMTFHDDRVERWTSVGKRFVVEHWFPGSGFPAATPVLGIAEHTP